MAKRGAETGLLASELFVETPRQLCACSPCMHLPETSNGSSGVSNQNPPVTYVVFSRLAFFTLLNWGAISIDRTVPLSVLTGHFGSLA